MIFFLLALGKNIDNCVYKCVAFCEGRRTKILYKALLGYVGLPIISWYLTENCRDASKYRKKSLTLYKQEKTQLLTLYLRKNKWSTQICSQISAT